MDRILIFILITYCSSYLLACTRINGNSFSPELPEYSNQSSAPVLLKRPLREISGIDYVNFNELLAVNDEQGKLFFVNTKTGKHRSIEFGKKGDYEDVIEAEGSYFVLNSNGELSEVSAGSQKLQTIYQSPFGKRQEFESICFDAGSRSLIVICKECGKNQHSIVAYRFNLEQRQWEPGPYFEIEWADIRVMAKDNSIECRPSAAAVNPRNGKLYILASLGKVLLRCSIAGKLEAVYGLNPDHFPQPEGITFSPEGNMFICNEGVEGKASLLEFSYRDKRIN